MPSFTSPPAAFRQVRAVLCLAVPVVCLLGPGQVLGQGGDVTVRGVMIPTGFQDGQYSVMIQGATEGSPLPDATWDIEAALDAPGRSPEKLSSQVQAPDPDVPVVLELPLVVRPGEYGLTLVAREKTAGQSGTVQIRERWPDPVKSAATVTPVVLLQPARGAFVRGESARTQGALAVVDDTPVQTGLPTALVSVVCRGPGVTDRVRVERTLEGAVRLDLEPILLEPGEDPCAQVRDLIQPGTLGPGHFRYEVRVVRGDIRIGGGLREFEAVAGGPDRPQNR
jgi:hypothetical protein